MRLENYIQDLLVDHNCVIVPDFGGFVANYRSAVIDDFKKRIQPPSKQILFNANLSSNDGLLGNYISKCESISYDEALKNIGLSVKEWRNVLNEGGRIEFGELGFLYHQQGRVVFEQSRELNLLLNAYGMSSINFVLFNEELAEKVKPVEPKETTHQEEKKAVPVLKVVESKSEEQKVEEKEEKVTSNEPEIIALNAEEEIEEVVAERTDVEDDHSGAGKGRKILKYSLGAAAAIPLLFYAYWIPMNTDFLETGQIQFSDFNPVHGQSDRKYNMRDSEFTGEEIVQPKSWDEIVAGISAETKVYNYQFAEDLYIPVLLDHDEVESGLDEVQTSINVNASYHIIAGCFSVKENADNHIKDLKANGFSAEILDKSGSLHRVTAGGFSSSDEARNALNNLTGKGFSGWILRK